MAIYATGVSGTIGRHLSSQVIELRVDLLQDNLEKTTPVFTEDDSLIHLAAVVGSNLVEEDIAKAYRINVQGTLELATKFFNQGGSRFVYVSTSHVYKNSLEPLEETSVVEPTTNYARQKLKAELELAQVFKESQEKLCVARVFSVLDWDVAPFTLGGAVSRLLDPDSDFVLKNGDDVRDFLTPKTIAATLESIAGIKSIFGTVNLCSGVGTKVSEAAKRMISTSGFETPTGRIEPGNSSAPVIVGVNSKLKSHFSDLHLHWEPSTHP